MASAAPKMASVAPTLLDAKISKSPGKIGVALFGLIVVVGLIYIGLQLSSDLSTVRSPSVYPFLLLGVALLIALGFEFVNGFHDTANAVATAIYTHSGLPKASPRCSDQLPGNWLGRWHPANFGEQHRFRSQRCSSE